MSAPRDIRNTDAGADADLISQDAGDESASPAHGHTTAPQAGHKDPDDPIGNPDPLPLGCSLDPCARPGAYDHLPAYPGINPNQNLENMFKAFTEIMLNDFEQGKNAAAESMATVLLDWAQLPLLYRAYCHIILAHGPGNRLYHARQAVSVAQQGVKDLGDDFIGEKIVEVLAEAEQTLRDLLDSGLYANTQTGNGEEAEGA